MTTPAWNGSTWMKDQPISHLPLHKLIIPGSHDAGAYKLYAREVAPFAPSLLKSCWIQYLCCCIPLNFAKAQTGTLYDQLSAGSRYLDVRIAFDMKTQRLRTEHSLYGLPVRELLSQIARFVHQEASEIVILHLRHFKVKQYYDMTDAHHALLVQMLHTMFDTDHFVRHNELQLSFQELKQKNRRIVLIYGTDTCVVNETWILSEKSVIPGGVGWLNAQTTQDMVASMKLLANTSTDHSYHKIAAAITPNEQLIKAGVVNCICCGICRLICAQSCKAPAGLGEVSDVVSDALIEELPTMVKQQGTHFNILDMDHVVRQQKRNRLIETIVMLNGAQCQHVVGEDKAKLIAPEERVAFANGEAEKVEEKVAAGAVGAAK